MRYLVSIHDVMPETLDRVEGLVARLRKRDWPAPILLVVPGREWTDGDLDVVRQLADQGCPLAGHGWRHDVPRFRSLVHRLHALALSRRAGEHYLLDAEGVTALVRRCRHWFDLQGLPSPDLYVPPAWALGPVGPGDLAGLGFRYVETLTGIFDTETSRHTPVPVLGFEADTSLRALLLGCSNGINRALATRHRALRVAIHPDDESLRLAGALAEWLAKPPVTVDIAELTARLPLAAVDEQGSSRAGDNA